MTTRFEITKLPDYKIANCFSFLHNRIIAIADQPGAHGFRILQLGVGSDLHVIELVGGRVVRGEGRILLPFQSLDQSIGVFLAANGSDLHVVTSGRRRRGGRNRGIGGSLGGSVRRWGGCSWSCRRRTLGR